MKPATKPGLLSIKEVQDRLCIADSDVIEATFERAMAMVTDENTRTARLDQKANSLLAGVGVALALAISRSPEKPSWWFVVGAALAVVSVGCALFALRVSAHLRLDERNVFGARSIYDNEKVEGATETIVEYRRAIMAASWEHLRFVIQWNSQRAQAVKFGQYAFGAAVVAVLVGIVTKACSA